MHALQHLTVFERGTNYETQVELFDVLPRSLRELYFGLHYVDVNSFVDSLLQQGIVLKHFGFISTGHIKRIDTSTTTPWKQILQQVIQEFDHFWNRIAPSQLSGELTHLTFVPPFEHFHF